MTDFVVSARKYRPQDFKDVVGQKVITETLSQAISRDQLAQALLFCGPRGVGKTTCARIVARKINQRFTPDIEEFSFNIFELDAASNNSVEDIRSLIDQVRFAPQQGKYKVYIIDEVHMLSQAAFNAFLKTLEEPPKHAIFVLATTEKHKIIPTILSRCQIYDFKRITTEDIKAHLSKICDLEQIQADAQALHLIAQKADGALRDALSNFDRILAFSPSGELSLKETAFVLQVLDYQVYLDLIDYAMQGDLQALLLCFDQVVQQGFDLQNFLLGFSGYLRDVLMAKDPKTHALLELDSQAKTKYIEQAQRIDLRFLLQAMDLCDEAQIKCKSSKNQRFTIELMLMQLLSLFKEPTDYVGKKKSIASFNPIK